MSAVSEVPGHCPLLTLPDPCLLAVLQCCAAEDQRSLCSAARAHSRLHKAAALALSSIDVTVRQQQQVDSVLLYLDKHGSHVNSLKLSQPRELGRDQNLALHHLPSTLQLHSLELSWWKLQLLPGKGFEGVLGGAIAAGAPPLKQLRLNRCKLLDGAEDLAAAFLQLPALEHLCFACRGPCFPTGVLQQLKQLTYLELDDDRWVGPDEAGPVLQPLSALTRLADLRVTYSGRIRGISTSMLSGMSHLTRLAVSGGEFEAGALAGKAKLQHLELLGCKLQPARGAGPAALLSQLQQRTQLTYLSVDFSMHHYPDEEGSSAAAAYAALTASSKLQHLDVRRCTLPAGAWQHMFPAGRQLLHLTSLDISKVQQPWRAALAPDGSRLVSCCPSLQSLIISPLQHSPQQLTKLQELSGLHTLRLETGTLGIFSCDASTDTGDTLRAVAQLTGLRELQLRVYDAPTQLLVTQLQLLQQLPHLTVLDYSSLSAVLKQNGPGDEPVWRQLMQLFLKDRNPDVVQQAAAALEH